ncbi:hypothetical protein [Pseudomonas mucidolens]|uniref:hypothetical protein n=1 Tax=Pseudomonas mucidolens TaxID=46679 RepID=UPI0030D96118
MSIVKGMLFVIFVVVLATVAFNGVYVAISVYFGPFYEGDADQSRNFAIWLLGNAVVILISAVTGVVSYRRQLRRGQV